MNTNALVINMHKGQRMDLTAQMKDADMVLGLFQAHEIRFEKKYTTITGEGPSTITFKGVRPQKAQAHLADLLSDLTIRARDNEIGNVYVKFVGLKPRVISTVNENGEKKIEAKDILSPEVTPFEDENDDPL